MSQPSKHSSLSPAPSRSLAGPNWVMLGLRNWGSGERGRRDGGNTEGIEETPELLSPKFVLKREVSVGGGDYSVCKARNVAHSANICVL